MFSEPWGFSLQDVQIEAIKLFYGTDDKNTHVRMGRYMQRQLKGVTLRNFEGAMHFTIDAPAIGPAILRDVLHLRRS